MSRQIQLDFFSLLQEAPDVQRFPTNLGSKKAESVVLADLQASQSFQVFTGYSSLDYIVQVLGNPALIEGKKGEIILGNEPALYNPRGAYRNLPDQVRDYWLERGISVYRCGNILALIEAIEKGILQFWLHPQLHAKMYIFDSVTIAGSSNFSAGGMRELQEVNVRFLREDRNDTERDQELRRIAHLLKDQARPFNDEIVALLQQLLQVVSWQEALARAVAELLEGKWAENYYQMFGLPEALKLWPLQEQAVVQALWCLEQYGSVLLADPAGAGKTRATVVLLLALLHRLWNSGQGYQGRVVVLCPPRLKDNWIREAQGLLLAGIQIFSQGALSNPNSKDHAKLINALRQGGILVIDEAHNYLNRTSLRGTSVMESLADYTILITATPLTKRKRPSTPYRNPWRG